MRYWVGCVFLVPALFLLWSVRQQLIDALRTSSNPAQSASQAEDLDPSSMAAFAQMARTVVMFMLGLLALKVTAAYIILDGGRYVSLFDLASTLFLLAAYAFWLKVKTAPRSAGQRSQAQRTVQPSDALDHRRADKIDAPDASASDASPPDASTPGAPAYVQRAPASATLHHLDTNSVSVAHLAVRPHSARQRHSGLESKS